MPQKNVEYWLRLVLCVSYPPICMGTIFEIVWLTSFGCGLLFVGILLIGVWVFAGLLFSKPS